MLIHSCGSFATLSRLRSSASSPCSNSFTSLPLLLVSLLLALEALLLVHFGLTLDRALGTIRPARALHFIHLKVDHEAALLANDFVLIGDAHGGFVVVAMKMSLCWFLFGKDYLLLGVGTRRGGLLKYLGFVPFSVPCTAGLIIKDGNLLPLIH